MENRNWKHIENYKYFVSDLGQVYSLHSNKILKTVLSNRGYPCFCLYLSNIKQNTVNIHRLVAQYFIIPCPDNLQVDHIDRTR